MEEEDYRKHLSRWIDERLRLGQVPRVQDVLAYAREAGLPRVKRKDVAQVVRLHPVYASNMPQQRERGRSQKHRPILVNSLGHLHADIMFYGTQARGFEAPSNHRVGFLIAKDVLSRFAYAVVIYRNRTARSMVKAFETLLERHAKVHPDYQIKSISFDKETSVMSKEVQAFFAQNNIRFHAFTLSASKAKAAEGCIRHIRTLARRLLRVHQLQLGGERAEEKWWTRIERAVQILNQQEIRIDDKPTGFAPAQITPQNLHRFRQRLQKRAPAYYFAQFDIDPKLVSFQFSAGDIVRIKKIAVSTAVVGQASKRSEESLMPDLFVVREPFAYVTRALTIGRAYKCANLETGKVDDMDESDLVLSEAPGLP